MSDFSVRITRRTDIDGKSHEETIHVETYKPKTIGIDVTAQGLMVGPVDGEQIPAFIETKHPGFTKLLADGSRVSGTDTRTDHVATIDHATSLMWAVESLGGQDDADDGIAQEHCIERCKMLRLLGYDDWRLATRAELAGLVDDTRYDPAIDISLFPKVKPRWHWTSTAVAGSSASAWFVHFGYGYVSGTPRDYDGFALAVRRVGQ
jgi:hypothetical protein